MMNISWLTVLLTRHTWHTHAWVGRMCHAQSYGASSENRDDSADTDSCLWVGMYVAVMLHTCHRVGCVSCISVAYMLHICCIYVAHMLHICCMYVAHMLHICCMYAAHMLHICCTYVTYMLHICCMHVACMLHWTFVCIWQIVPFEHGVALHAKLQVIPTPAAAPSLLQHHPCLSPSFLYLMLIWPGLVRAVTGSSRGHHCLLVILDTAAY